MKIGDKFVLVNSPPYHTFIGHNTKPVKFIEIEIIESKNNVSGEFTGKPAGTGFLAKSTDGYQYGYNWRTYNEGYGETCWVRTCSNEAFSLLSEEEKDKMVEDYLWMDVIHYQCPASPIFLEKYDFIKYCKKHQHCYYPREKCWRCACGIPKPKVNMNITRHRWIGWY